MTQAIPILRGRGPFNQVLNVGSFWLMTGGMAFMTFVLTFAGTIQTHMQRVVGDYFMDVQDSLSVLFIMRFGAGVVVVLCAFLLIYSMLVVRKHEVIAPGPMMNVPGEQGTNDMNPRAAIPPYHPTGQECDLCGGAGKRH
jgi:nitric oxide reductase subunit B